MSHVGEVRESDHIACRHWNMTILLTAWRSGNGWRIHRSDTGQTVLNPDLEFKDWVERSEGYDQHDMHARWAGENFGLTYSNGADGGISHTINYHGHDPHQGELWQCFWDPRKELF